MGPMLLGYKEGNDRKRESWESPARHVKGSMELKIGCDTCKHHPTACFRL